MAGEQLNFDIFARLREDGFAKAGKAASAASDDVLGLAKRLDELSRKSATARVNLAGDKEALAQLDKLDLKLLTTGRRVVDPKITLDGAARAQADIAGLDVSLDKLGAKSEKATTSVGSGAGGLSGVSGMGALIAAGVVLSPILATVATGVGGFGLAAASAVGPIVKAAGATGGLRANMAKLDPEQRKLAGSILGLGKQYDVFSKSLQPEVLSVFNKGVQLAGNVMHDVQPVAAATGKALGGMLGQIDKEFQSGTWQNFFGFMARTAGPDVKLVADAFVSLMGDAPPLLEALQPVAVELLKMAGTAANLVGDFEHLIGATTTTGDASKKATPHLNALGQTIKWVSLFPVAQAFWKSAQAITHSGDASQAAGKQISVFGDSAAATKLRADSLAKAVTGLTAAMQTNVGEVLTLQGDEVAWRQSLQAATKQLDSNSAGLTGNSKNALANKAAVLATSNAAMTFAGDQIKLGGDLQGASQRIQDQIKWLQQHGDKSAFATREIHALRVEEGKLQATIRQRLLVTASGFWKVTGALPGGTPQGPGGGPAPHAAAGWKVTGGTPGVDSVPILAQRDETVVSVEHSKRLAPIFAAIGVPGYAAGGVVGNYSGAVGGAPKWLAMQDAATLRAVEVATAAATTAGIKSAQHAARGGFGGIGGGGSGTNVQIGKRMAASIGWTGNNWAFLDSGWQEESGWRTNAANDPSDPYNHAYGIPQSNPGTKMAAAGSGWKTDPATQIRWGLGYIRGTYGSPTRVPLWSAHGPLPGYVGYAAGGIVGAAGAKAVSPAKAKMLRDLARDVADRDKQSKARDKAVKAANTKVRMDELWLLEHPGASKNARAFHELALTVDRKTLRGIRRVDDKKIGKLDREITLLRSLTGYPADPKYGGHGTGGGAGGGAGDGSGGATGGSTPPAPPPIPPPPMPAWMIAAGLGGAGAGSTGGFTFPPMGTGQYTGPIAYQPAAAGMGWGAGGGAGSGGAAEMIRQLDRVVQVLGQVHQAVRMVAPGTTRGFDRSLNSMAGSVAGKFS